MSHESPKTFRSFFFRILLPLAVVVVAIAVGLWMMETKPQAKPRPRTKNATLVETRPVSFASATTVVSAMGTVRPSLEVELRPQASGEIVSMNDAFVPGGRFRMGEVILKVDPNDYTLAIRQLSSEVAKADAELKLEQGNQLIARKEYELLGEEVSEEEEALMLRRPQLSALQAALEGARARLEQARIDLARTEISAPFNAVVQSRGANVGTRVTPSTLLATLIGTDSCWIEVSVPVVQLPWISIPGHGAKEGSVVRIYDRAAWGEDVFRLGRVAGLAADLEEKGRMARLLVDVPDPLALKPGNAGLPKVLINSYVRVEIEGRKIPGAVAVERELLRDGENVWIMDGDDRLDVRGIEIAFRGEEKVLVTGGLKEAERLIVSAIPSPVPGMSLREGGVEEPETADRERKPAKDGAL